MLGTFQALTHMEAFVFVLLNTLTTSSYVEYEQQ